MKNRKSETYPGRWLQSLCGHRFGSRQRGIKHSEERARRVQVIGDQDSKTIQILDGVLNHPRAEAAALRALVQAYASINHLDGVRQAAGKLEALVRANPGNFAAANALAEAYRHLQKPDVAIRALDGIINHPKVTASAVVQAAQQYAALSDPTKMEAALIKLTQLAPDLPEAWYDLAALRTALGKPQEALTALRRALDLSAKRKATDPKARDLAAEALKDASFTTLRENPEFKQLTGRF